MSLRKEHALHLSAGKRIERALLKAGESDRLERFGDAGALAGVEGAEEADARHRAHGDEVPHIDRKGAIDVDDLRQIGDVAGRPAAPVDAPAERRQKPGERLEQGRFASAIRTADGETCARRDLALEMVDGGTAIISQGEIEEPDRRRRQRGRAQCSAQ